MTNEQPIFKSTIPSEIDVKVTINSEGIMDESADFVYQSPKLEDHEDHETKIEIRGADAISWLKVAVSSTGSDFKLEIDRKKVTTSGTNIITLEYGDELSPKGSV